MIIENEKRFCTLIKKIEGNYGMYIGEKSLTSLSHFLNGYRFRFYEECKYLFEFQKEFQKYVEIKYQQTGVYAWNDIILRGLHEDDAFDAFYRLFNQFLSETEYGGLLFCPSSSRDNQKPRAENIGYNPYNT